MLDALASVQGETKWVLEALRSYDQAIATENANYATKIDLNNLNGFRAGLTFRF
jgi:hypothetical protein